MLLVLLLCVTPFSADKVEIIKENGESVVYLVGNVAIEDEHTKITCAEARLNEAQKYVILLNHVIISDKSGTINADYARYYFDDRRGYLSGNVTLTRSEEIISADSLYYNGMEDIDLCHRVTSSGYKVIYCGSARLIHGEQSMPERYVHDQGNLCKYAYQWLGYARDDMNQIYELDRNPEMAVSYAKK